MHMQYVSVPPGFCIKFTYIARILHNYRLQFSLIATKKKNKYMESVLLGAISTATFENSRHKYSYFWPQSFHKILAGSQFLGIPAGS